MEHITLLILKLGPLGLHQVQYHHIGHNLPLSPSEMTHKIQQEEENKSKRNKLCQSNLHKHSLGLLRRRLQCFVQLDSHPLQGSIGVSGTVPGTLTHSQCFVQQDTSYMIWNINLDLMLPLWHLSHLHHGVFSRKGPKRPTINQQLLRTLTLSLPVMHYKALS